MAGILALASTKPVVTIEIVCGPAEKEDKERITLWQQWLGYTNY